MADTKIIDNISTNLSYLGDTKADIADAISQHVDSSGNNITVPNDAKFRDYVGLINKIRVGNNIETESLDVSKNGSYDASEGHLFNPVEVEVEANVGSIDITKNGTYNAADEGLDGWDSISIDVEEADETTTETGSKKKASGKGKGDLKLDSGEFHQNGVFYAKDADTKNKEEHPLDGWDEIEVEVAPEDQVPNADTTFKVEYYNDAGGTLLYTDPEVPYGGKSTYKGPEVKRDKMYFVGWKPSPSKVKTDLKVYAQFSDKKIETKEIEDDWETIVEDPSSYAIGSYKTLSLGDEYGSVRMKLVFKGEDGTATTWVAMDPLKKQLTFSRYKSTTYGSKDTDGDEYYHANPTKENGGKPYDDYYVASGWRTSGLKAILNSEVYNAMPAEVRKAIRPVDKCSRADEYFYGESSYTFPNSLSQDLVWAPSFVELFGKSTTAKESNQEYKLEEKGVNYNKAFKSNKDRIVKVNNTAITYMLRSAYGGPLTTKNNSTGAVSPTGTFTAVSSLTNQNVIIGFCMGGGVKKENGK